MSLFRRVAGAFVELPPEAQEEQPQAVQPVAQQPVAAMPTYQPNVQAAMPRSYAPSVNEEMVQALTSVATKRQTAYTAFIDASRKLEAVLPDENTRIKAAFVTVNGEGRTLDQMLTSIDIHIMDVNTEVERFDRVSEVNSRNEVDAKKAQAQSLLNQNDEIARQIAALQQQASDLAAKAQENSSTAATLVNEAEHAAIEIANVKAQFSQAAEFVKQQMTDRKNMLSALIPK